jgi:signal transduction histidine kinase
MIIYNVLSNAIESITEKAKNKDIQLLYGIILVKIDYTNNTLIITIEDNGKGIDNAISDLIYNPGFSTKDYDNENKIKGTGIGLFFVKEVLNKSLNGSIRFESKFGEYAKFIIEIPKY